MSEDRINKDPLLGGLDGMRAGQTWEGAPEKMNAGGDGQAASETEPEPEAEPAGLNPAFLLVVLAALGGIGALVYFKFIKQKSKTKGSDNLDDYDYGADEELPEDETWETEPEEADGGGDEESENPVK